MKAWMRLLLAITAGAVAWLSFASRDRASDSIPALAGGVEAAAPSPPSPAAVPRDSEESLAPNPAATSILSRPPADRLAAASALLIDLADAPEAAANLARTLCALDPDFVREHGSTLVTVLTSAGSYPAALHFAANGGPERVHWLELTFAHWARADPRAAVEAALARPDQDGLSIVCAEWNKRDPAGFAFFVQESPGIRSAAAQAGPEE